MSDEHDEDVEMSVGDDTFSTIHTPNARRQHEHLKLAPPMGTQFHEGLGSQMNQKSMYEKLRKPLGIVDSEWWSRAKRAKTRRASLWRRELNRKTGSRVYLQAQ